MALVRHSFTVQNGAGDVAAQVLLEVRREEYGLPLASLYRDREGTIPLGNPVLLSQDEAGLYFHAAGGAYKVQVTTSEGVTARRYVAIGTAQEEDWLDFGDLAFEDDAAGVAFTPAGNLAATDVQAALEELDDEKEPADATILKEANVEDSIVISGGGNVQLENDEASPGASEFYGTDIDGVRGWRASTSNIELLDSGTASNQAVLDIDLTSFTSYRFIEIVLTGLLPATDDADLYMRFSTDGGSTFDATGYDSASFGLRDQGSQASTSGVANQILMTNPTASQGVSNVAAEGGLDALVSLMGRTETRWTRALWKLGYINAGAEGSFFQGQGARETAQDTNAVRFLFDTGNIASGDWAVYGYS